MSFPTGLKTDAERIEAAIRDQLAKPKGKLTKEDLDDLVGVNIEWGKCLGHSERDRLTDISTLARWTKLQELHLDGNKLTGGQLEHLAKLKKLERLRLSENPLTDGGCEGIFAINALTKLKKLKELFLIGCDLTDIRPLEGLLKLESLWLSENKIIDEQLKHLCGLTELRDLDLEDNPDLTEEVLYWLATKLPECKIRHDYNYGDYD